MSRRVHRREFVRQAGRGAVASALLSVAGSGAGSLVGCGGARESASSREDREWASRLAGLEKTIPKLMAQTRTPGLSIAIIRDAKVAWTRGFGVADRASGAVVDDGTIFEAASMSKPVFAYAVMKLCERGVLRLDSPLLDYTPERMLKGDARLNLITARHVLSHTAGFQDSRSGDKPLKIHFTPGEQWMYSGEGYYYLQSVVTHLEGRVDRDECSQFEDGLTTCATDFDAYMRANLLAPFGMESSGYLWPNETAASLARPHNQHGEPLPYRKPTAAAVARYGAMGALLTTATDYAKFLIEVIDPKPADRYRLSRESLAEMLHPQIKVEDGDGYSIWWALGWRVARTAKGDLVSHGGDQTGFHSTSEISVAGKSGYVILTNGDNGWKLIKDLAPEVSRWVHPRHKA